MPYIEQQIRGFYDKELDALIFAVDGEWSPGTVNYIIFKIMLAWFKSAPRYHTICSIMGTLSCVAQEFYRKVASPYENKAIEKNGDVT